MSRTNLDFLFQVSGQIGDRVVNPATRGDEPVPAFGDHLSQASATPQGDTGKSARRDEIDYGRTDNRRSASDSPSNGGHSPKTEASRDAPAAVNRTTDREPKESDADESSVAEEPRLVDPGGKHTTADEVSNGEATESNDGEDDERESEHDSADELPDAAVVAVGKKLNQNAAIVKATETFHEALDATETPAQNESSAVTPLMKRSDEAASKDRRAAPLIALGNPSDDAPELRSTPTQPPKATTNELIDQPVATKEVKKSRNAPAAQALEEDAHANRVAPPRKRYSANGLEVESLAPLDTAMLTDEPPNIDESSNAMVQTGETDPGSDETNRESSARSTSRQRGDADAIAQKIATMAVANGVATQSREGAASVDAVDRAQSASKSVDAKSDGLTHAANQLHANQGSAKRAGRANGQDQTPRVDPARFVGRVAKAFHAAQERGGTLQLRLSPPELGSMRLELTVKDGVLTAALETETAAARRVLLDHLPALRDRLAEQNIRVERFDVELRRDGSGGGQPDPRTSQEQQQQQQRQGHPEGRRPATQPRADDPARRDPSIAQPLTNSTSINLVA